MVLLWVSLLAPAAASGTSSGEITRAEVSPDWTTASISGTAVRSNYCPPLPPPPPPGPEGPEKPGEKLPVPPSSPPWRCGWIPFATVGPGSTQADCTGLAGEGVQLVWVGSEIKGPGSEGFDLPVTALQHGSAAPLLCLYAVETVYERRVCIPEIDCSGYGAVHHTHRLDSALLEVVPPPLAPSIAPPPPPEPVCSISKPVPKRFKKKGRIGLGPSVRVTRKGRPVKRCKTG